MSNIKFVDFNYYITYSKALYNSTSLNEGVGNVNWNLVACLAISWLLVFFIIARGIKGSGKFSYFLALFPYVMMTIILVRVLLLPGAFDGIKEFLIPSHGSWKMIFKPSVWYAAVTQVFFSLNVYFANVIMYSSYNKFNHKVHIDANIVTTLDTFTSLLAGCCVFATLGYLKYETGAATVSDVMKPGPLLAFITYPEALSKFGSLSTYLAIVFFLMLYTLGIGKIINFLFSK